MSIPVSNIRNVLIGLQHPALGTAESHYTASPVSGFIKRITMTVDVATNDIPVVATTIAGTAITGGSKTFGNADAVGTVYVLEPTAANYVRKGQGLSVSSDGAGSAGVANVIFMVEQD